MPISYSTPGIYVEEVATGPRPIQALGTSTAGFVGVAPNPSKRLNEAVALHNWSQFVREFVGDMEPTQKPRTTSLAAAVFGFFQNGGSRCYVVNVGLDRNGQSNAIVSDGRARQGLQALEPLDDVSIVAAPGYADITSYDALLSHCERLKNRVAILDAPADVDAARIDALTQVATAIATDQSDDTDNATSDVNNIGLRPRQSDSGYGAFYFPWITIQDPFAPKSTINVPPSGHVAGVYARTDATRGVHKAPANEPLRGALNLTYRVTHAEQGPLNDAGVNCIRFFQGQGIRVWGGRTLADTSSEWRYINVRRLFCMIEASIAQGTRWVVFEPNDVPLWKAMRRDVSAFLTRLWQDGALMGVTPEEAFFVQCDAETNPPDVINAGQLVMLIGVAPVKPAEFIIFRIGQYASGIDTEEATAG